MCGGLASLFQLAIGAVVQYASGFGNEFWPEVRLSNFGGDFRRSEMEHAHVYRSDEGLADGRGHQDLRDLVRRRVKMQVVAHGDVLESGDESGEVRVGCLRLDPPLDGLGRGVGEGVGVGTGTWRRDRSTEGGGEGFDRATAGDVAYDPRHLRGEDSDLPRTGEKIKQLNVGSLGEYARGINLRQQVNGDQDSERDGRQKIQSGGHRSDFVSGNHDG